MKKLKTKKGITLIALVITIILLLILAGVTVATITGENGLLSKTQLAKERTTEAEDDEKDKLSSYENEIDNYGTWERTGGSTITISEEELERRINDAVSAALENSSITYDTLYEGAAGTKNTTYNLLHSINDYKYIIVYANTDGHCTSVCIDKSAYNIGQYRW